MWRLQLSGILFPFPGTLIDIKEDFKLITWEKGGDRREAGWGEQINTTCSGELTLVEATPGRDSAMYLL